MAVVVAIFGLPIHDGHDARDDRPPPLLQPAVDFFAARGFVAKSALSSHPSLV